jgi:RNA polymerase sigma-70 factor (ECF subfamily)
VSAVAAARALPDVGVLESAVGSPDAYAGRLYERHNRAIFRLCLRELRAREDADDAVQTTFVYALMSLRRGVVPQLELPWLLTIARNVCSTRRRSGMRRRFYEAPQDLDAIQDRLAAPDRSDVATTEDFSVALRAIPESQRKALLLREWKGLSYDEIGSELGLSQAATEALLFRARQNVAQRLGAKVGLKSLSGLPLPSLLRNLVQSAAGKAIAVGAGAAFTVVAVPSAQQDVGVGNTLRTPPAHGHTHQPARAATKSAVSQAPVSSATAAARSERPAAQRARGRALPDVAAQQPDVAGPHAAATSPPRVAPSSTTVPPLPAPPASVSSPTETAGALVDGVAATATGVAEDLGLPPVTVPDISVQTPVLQTPPLPVLPSVHVP